MMMTQVFKLSAGTKTILFGTHQFLIHPCFVFTAWLIIYRKLPKLYEFLAILTHDLGYWGLPNIDGKEGEQHPIIIAEGICGGNIWREGYPPIKFNIAKEILGHSRFFSFEAGIKLSKLFYDDKLGVALYPRWLYLLLGNLSGEIKEYMGLCEESHKYGHQKQTSQIKWLIEVQSKMALMGLNKLGNTQESIERNLKEQTIS